MTLGQQLRFVSPIRCASQPSPLACRRSSPSLVACKLWIAFLVHIVRGRVPFALSSSVVHIQERRRLRSVMEVLAYGPIN
jgi:hypothetical protein